MIDIVKNYKNALNQLRRDKDFYLEKNPKIFAVKSNIMNSVKDYEKHLENEIYTLREQLNRVKNELEALREDTQLLVTYCDVIGVNPNEIYNLKKYQPSPLKDLQFILDNNMGAVKKSCNVNFQIVLVRMMKEINKGLINSMEFLPETEQFLEHKQLIINDCSQSIYTTN